MQQDYLFLLILLLDLAMPAQAQRVVQGVVRVASDKGPLPGVTVLLKGTQIGTSTDMNGEFRLVVPDDTATLQFMSVGFVGARRKISVTKDIVQLTPVFLQAACNIDFFYSKYLELALVSALRYAPLGGKGKVFYPYLFHLGNHSAGSLRAEFSYQTGPHSYQRNATLAVDDLFVDCAYDIGITTDYQSVGMSERGLAYARYTVGATYTGELVSRTIPLHLAFGGLHYATEAETATKAGVEVGATYPIRTRSALQIAAVGSVAWWQSFWQYRAGVEAEFRRFTAGVNFNKLGSYAEINTSVGFRIQKRFRAKKKN